MRVPSDLPHQNMYYPKHSEDDDQISIDIYMYNITEFDE